MAKLVGYKGLLVLMLLCLLLTNVLKAQKKYALIYKAVDTDSFTVAELKLSSYFNS